MRTMKEHTMSKNLTEFPADALIPAAEQPYPVPENWAWVKLGSLTETIQYGYTETSSEEKIGPKFLRITDIQDNTVNWEDVPYCKIENEQFEKYKLQENDLIIARTGATTGKSFLIKDPPDAVFASYLIRLTINPLSAMSELVWKFMQSPYYWAQIIDMKQGIAQPGVNAKKLAELKFPLPLLDEQRRIVTKLDSLLGKLREARALIQDARDTFATRRAALLHKAFTGELTAHWRAEHQEVETRSEELFDIEEKPFDIPETWKWLTINDLSEKLQYGSSNKSSSEGKIPVVRMGNIQNGVITWDDLVYTSDPEEIEKYILSYNDVLFNRTNSPELVGKTAIYKGEMPAIYAGYLIRIKASTAMIPDYLNYYLNSPYARQKCRIIKTDGVSQSNINAKKLGNFEIPLPPLSEQHEIVRRLDSLLTYETEAAGLLDLDEQLDLLEKSILARAFRGELVPHDPAED